MFENITNGWKLASAIRKIALQDRGLLVYPIVSGIVILLETIAIFASFFISIVFLNGGVSTIVLLVALFAYYVIIYFTSVFILVSMLLAFRSYEDGKPIGIGTALSQATSYSMLILEWAIFESIVTMIIRAIESRIRGIGGMLLGLGASMAISVATLFAIPVIIDKKTGPISTVRESVGFITKNFGSSFGGLVYSDLYSLMFMLAGVLLIIVSLFSLVISIALFAVLFAFGLLLLVYGVMLSYMLSNVYKFVLYDYKNGGRLPKGLSKDLLDNVITSKPGAMAGSNTNVL